MAAGFRHRVDGRSLEPNYRAALSRTDLGSAIDGVTVDVDGISDYSHI